MKDKTQRLTQYKSGAGLTVYGAEQYNASARDWFIVGDCTLDKKYIQATIKLHNIKL